MFIPIERAPRANISIDSFDNYQQFQNNAATNYNYYLTFQTERLQVELRLFLEYITNRFLSSNTLLRALSVRFQDEFKIIVFVYYLKCVYIRLNTINNQ